MKPVLKVAKKGVDIRTAGLGELSIDSTKNQFKVYEYGTESISLNSANGYVWEKEITHNLGYVPYVLAKMNNKFTKSGSSILINPIIFAQLPVFTQPVFDGDATTYAFIFGSFERDNNTYKIKVEESDKMLGMPVYYDIEDINLTFYLFVDKQLEL